MKHKINTIVIILSALLCIIAYVGTKHFERNVDSSEGVLEKYHYIIENTDENISIDVSTKESWFKALPDGFVIDNNFADSEFAGRNEINQIECIGRTVEVTINNTSDYRINKWEIEYTVPCDMYFNKAWNGTVELHQFNDTNVQEINALENPTDETTVKYDIADELFLYPLKKGDKIIYHPNEFEVPIVEPVSDEEKLSSMTIGFIFYTEDDTFRMEDFNIRYYLVKGLDEYPMYIFLKISSVVMALIFLGAVIFITVSMRYDRMRKHDMDIISQAIGTFSKFIDSKDKYTNNHSYRVAEYSRLIARKLRLSENECEDIYYIGLLHDTGKVFIDDKILNKPGRLTSQEYEVIKSHTTKGADLLNDFTAIKNISVGALYHHERFDGKGYPAGIIGEEIPLVARIICVADSYDAMSSTRCYRAQLDKEQIVEQLVTNKGKQFDPKIVDVFLELINSGEVDEVRRSIIES